MAQIQGVNLGGWLVLERWITPSLFAGLAAEDEKSFCLELGSKKHETLKLHRESYITEDDFQWLSTHAVNAVRIPVGHWLFGGFETFVPASEYLDKAFEWSKKYSMHVLLDLHTAPGSQNGHDHSGEIGEVNWHEDQANINQTLQVIESLAQRYGDEGLLIGIELLNEPDSKIPHDLLLQFYRNGYDLVRQHCHSETAVVISDAYRPFDWQDVLNTPDFRKIWLDTHHYQVFSYEDKQRNIHVHLQYARVDQKYRITEMNKRLPIIIGEWSLGLPSKVLRGMDEFERDKALQAYALAQLEAFDGAIGHFFWTYKTEDKPGWSFREAVKRGWVNFKR